MTDLTAGCTRTGPHPARNITEMEKRAEGHTPTPWHIEGGHIPEFWSITRTATNDDVAYLTLRPARANAAFIALACNSYESMRAALDLARAELALDRDSLFQSCTIGGNPETLDPEDAAEIARMDNALSAIDSALSLSRGGTDKKEGA